MCLRNDALMKAMQWNVGEDAGWHYRSICLHYIKQSGNFMNMERPFHRIATKTLEITCTFRLPAPEKDLSKPKGWLLQQNIVIFIAFVQI